MWDYSFGLMGRESGPTALVGFGFSLGMMGMRKIWFCPSASPRVISPAQGAGAHRIPFPGQVGEHSSGAEQGWDLPLCTNKSNSIYFIIKQPTASDLHILLACNISYDHVHRIIFFFYETIVSRRQKKKGEGDNTYLHKGRFTLSWV